MHSCVLFSKSLRDALGGCSSSGRPESFEVVIKVRVFEELAQKQPNNWDKTMLVRFKLNWPHRFASGCLF